MKAGSWFTILVAMFTFIAGCSNMGSKDAASADKSSATDCEHQSATTPGCDNAKAAGASGVATPVTPPH
jgi:hypothetical protein